MPSRQVVLGAIEFRFSERLKRTSVRSKEEWWADNLCLESFYKSQFPHKSVNLFIILVIVKDKLTDLWAEGGVVGGQLVRGAAEGGGLLVAQHRTGAPGLL